VTGVQTCALPISCRQIRQWELSGIDVPRIAINVSGRQLEDPLFVSRLLTTMHEIGCSASQLSIELTESTLMTRHERIMSALEQLRAAGLSIAIDDFGTGYSSMAYLKNFPVSKLKIDRSFINDVTEDPQDMAITAAMIALGRGLNMHVVAEGVESAEQATLLRSLGCSSLQGYHFSRPLPAAEFLEFCAARRPVLTHTNVKTDVT
jgi:EAL domain-containing protein (putative c-di-GMP-specific phosphodiesterase class I)